VIGFLTSQPIVSFARHGRISICYVVVGNGPRPFIPILSQSYILLIYFFISLFNEIFLKRSPQTNYLYLFHQLPKAHDRIKI
jgi:hypothetical protein